jgi:hypothetical protein
MWNFVLRIAEDALPIRFDFRLSECYRADSGCFAKTFVGA